MAVGLALFVAWGLKIALTGASGRAAGLPGHVMKSLAFSSRMLLLPRLRLRGGRREVNRAEPDSSSPPPPPPLDQDEGTFDCEADFEVEPSPVAEVGDDDGSRGERACDPGDQPGMHTQAPRLFHTAAMHAIKLVDDGGVCIETLRAGTGDVTPRDGDFVYVHYRAFVLGDPDRQAEILRSQRLSSPIVI